MRISELLQRLSERFANWRLSRHDLPNPICHMFIEDVHAAVVPYPHRPDRTLAAHVEGTEADVREARLSLRSLAEYAHADDAEELIPDVVRTVVQHMLWRGYAAFTIDEPTREEDHPRRNVLGEPAENLSPFRPLQPMPHRRLFSTPLGIVEFFGTQNNWSRRRKVLRFYPKRRIWLVDVPRELGGRLGFWLMMERLARFPDVFPQWSSRALLHEQARVRFDVTGYAQLRTAYHAASAGRWGWSARDVSTTYQTEFFAVYRTMMFHHSLAVLREHVIVMLNLLLQERLALDARVELSGPPSAREISALVKQMKRGDISLLAALEQAWAI